MSLLTVDLQKEHEKYEGMSVEKRSAIHAAFKAATKALVDNGVRGLAMDDRAEELIAALAYYVRRSSSL